MKFDFFKKKNIDINEEEVDKILKKFIKSYIENEKSENKKSLEVWLTDILQKEISGKEIGEIKKIAIELISGVIETNKKINEIEQKRKIGIKPADCIKTDILDYIENGELNTSEVKETLKEMTQELEKQNISTIYELAAIKEPDLVAEYIDLSSKSHGIDKVESYIDNIVDTIEKGNEKILNKIYNKDGTINQGNNLDGFLFEHDHVNTFNIDAAVQNNQKYVAEVLEPKPGETYKKNSVDLVIRERNTGKIVRKYQCKSYKNAEDTMKAFNKGDYRGQRKLTPGDQEIKNTNVNMEYDGIKSKPQGKKEEKAKQEEVQKGNTDVVKRSFSKDVEILKLAKQLGRQTMLSGTEAMAKGMICATAKNIILDEDIEPEEIVIDGLKIGGNAMVSTAVAGGLRTAVEKKAITGTLAKVLSINNVTGALAASSTDILKTTFALGNGDISFNEGCGRVGSAVSAYYGRILGAAKGKALGQLALKGLGGILGATGIFGTALTFGIPAVLGAIGGFVGSNVLGAIGNGLGKIGGAVVNGTVGIVKAGAGAVKTVAGGVWSGAKAIGRGAISVGGGIVRGVTSVGSSIVSGVGSVVGGISRGIGSFFGW